MVRVNLFAKGPMRKLKDLVDIRVAEDGQPLETRSKAAPPTASQNVTSAISN
jgi:hypothetical protein